MLFSVIRSVSNQPRRIIANSLLRTYTSTTDTPKYETLAVSVPKPHVYHVELNRPDKLNSFNYKMWLDLKKCFEDLSDNRQCRVVVLSGQGKHFTAGIDVNSFIQLSQQAQEFDDIARKTRHLYQGIKVFQDGISALEQCVKPVVSVIHRACIGAGVDLVTAADIRYCTEDAFFQVKEVDIGLAADVGTLQRLPKVIGNASIARELCYTARKLEAKEAKEIGLVSNVFKDKDSALSHALQIAATIASKSPVAVQTTKQSILYSQDRTVDEGLEHIRLINQVMLQTDDVTQSAVAFLSKGDSPEFEDF